MVSRVQPWDTDSVLSHSHPTAPPVLINSLASWSYSIHIIFISLIEHYWMFLSWLYSAHSISGDLNIHFLMLSSPNSLYLAHREGKYRDLEQSCSPATDIFIWKCQDLARSIGTAHAAVTNPTAPQLTLTVLQPEELPRSWILSQPCCELEGLRILQMSTDLSSFGEGAATQLRKSLMFLQQVQTTSSVPAVQWE